MEENQRILLIVPAYNEEAVIESTLETLVTFRKEHNHIDICVIDDGSLDNTSLLVQQFDVILIKLPFNLGIGGAVQTGYMYGHRNNYDIAIQFDADGQHQIEFLKALLTPLLQEDCDMVIGSRFIQKTNYQGSVLRRIGILYFSNFICLLTGKKITDSTSGYRAVNRNVIQYFAHEYPKDYPEPEVLIHLHRKNYTIKEVTVQMTKRQGGKSSITPIKSLRYVVQVSLSILIGKLKKGV